VIPADVLERGERAFVQVLRRQHPDALFLVCDCPVRPDDPNVPGEVPGGAAGDDHAVEEADENIPSIEAIESLPKVGEGASRRDSSQAPGKVTD
jgi:hypothetical protein